jgi:hypothetical protein
MRRIEIALDREISLTQDPIIKFSLSRRLYDAPPILANYARTSIDCASSAYLSAQNELGVKTVNTIFSDSNQKSQQITNLKDAISKLSDCVQTVSTDLNCSFSVKHNAYVDYCLFVLLLFTGHRPVRDSFWSLTQMDIEDQMLLIDDKSKHDYDYRLSFINDVCASIITSYVGTQKFISFFNKE